MTERPVAIGLFREALQRFGQGETATAARLADRARELFLASGDADGACAAAILRGRTSLRAGRWQEAMDAFLWADDEASRRGLVPRSLTAKSELAVVAELQGHVPTAVAMHRHVLYVQRERDDNLGIAMAAGNVARLLPCLGGEDPVLVQEANDLLLEALRRFRDGPHESGVANTLVCLADQSRAARQLPEALAHLREVTQMIPTPSVQPIRASAWLNVGHVLRQMGHFREALLAYSEASDLAAQVGDTLGNRQARVARWMTQAQMEPDAKQRAAMQLLARELRSREDFNALAVLDMNRAIMAAGWGDLGTARIWFANARDWFQDRGDAQLAEEAELGFALASIPRQSDRLAWKLLLRRGKRPPGMARSLDLLAATLHTRRLNLAGFDAAAGRLSEPRTWQEQVDLAILDSQRQALVGVDATAALETLRAKALEHQALVDAARLLTAEAWAELWLGRVDLAHEAATTALRELDELDRPLFAAGPMLIQALALALGADAPPIDVPHWQRCAAVVRVACEARTTKHALDAALHVYAGELDACDEHLQGLKEAGDLLSTLVFRAARGKLQGPAAMDAVATQLQALGLWIPYWLRTDRP